MNATNVLVVLLIVGVAAGLVWFYWRRRQERDSPLISLVALLREPVEFDALVLAKAAGKAWNADLGDGTNDGEDGFVVSRGPFSMMRFDDRHFLIHCIPAPYVENPEEAAKSIGDQRIRELFARHQAWFSFDAMPVDDNGPADGANQWYPLLAKLFVEFLDENCLLIYSPAINRTWPINEATHQALLSDHPLEALQETLTVPVINVSNDDPLMQKAVKKARHTWPEFVAAFDSRTGTNFAIKAPVTAGGNTEFIWIDVTATEGEQIFGKLANEPMALGALKLGSKVVVKLEDLNDWCYIDRQGNLQGVFTMSAMQRAARRQ